MPITELQEYLQRKVNSGHKYVKWPEVYDLIIKWKYRNDPKTIENYTKSIRETRDESEN